MAAFAAEPARWQLPTAPRQLCWGRDAAEVRRPRTLLRPPRWDLARPPLGIVAVGAGLLARRGHRTRRWPGGSRDVRVQASAAAEARPPWLEGAYSFRDKLPWEYSEEATAFARELREAQPEEVDAHLWVFKLGKGLTEDQANNGTTLLVREHQRKVWDAALRLLKGGGVRKIAMIGNPGIGKSRSLTYGLWRLMGGAGLVVRGGASDSVGGAAAPRASGEAPVILYEARHENAVFAFVPPGKDLTEGAASAEWRAYCIDLELFRPGACAALRDERNYYLIDPAEATGCPTAVRARTIIACSPDPKHYKEWTKDGAEELYVTPYTAGEVEAALRHVEFPKTNELLGMDEEQRLQEVRSRFREVGGILRVLLGTKSAFKRHLKQRATQLENYAMIHKVVLGGSLEALSPAAMPTYLFKYVPDELTDETHQFSAFTILNLATDWVSEGALEATMTKHYDSMMQDFSAVHAGASEQQAKGRYWESFCGWLLAGGGQKVGLTDLAWRPVGTGDAADRFPLPMKKLRHIDTTEEMNMQWKASVEANTCEDILHVPDKNYPGFDFLVTPRHAVNATLQVKGKTIAPACVSTVLDLKIENFQLSFMIPATNTAEFRVERRSLTAAARVQSMQLRILAVPLRRGLQRSE